MTRSMLSAVFVLTVALAALGCGGGAPETQETSAASTSGTSTPDGAASSQPAEPPADAAPAEPSPPPVIVVETAKGTFEFETYPDEAPRTVAQIVALVNRSFYNGQRFHRVIPNFMVQWGDPTTKDNRRRAEWGNNGSGKPIGVAEISPTRKHRIGAVAMAHAGDPKRSDSQMYVVTGPASHLDGDYTIFGQIISGMDVVRKIEQDDMVKKVTIRAGTPAAK